MHQIAQHQTTITTSNIYIFYIHIFYTLGIEI